LATRLVTFPAAAGEQFAEEVKSRAAAYFAERGISCKATPGMVAKTVVLWSVFAGSYFLILLAGFSPLAMLGLCVVMGVAMAGIGFAVAHDALHGAYSDNPRVNALLGYSFDVLGANGYMWKITHNVIHHTYTNIQGIDEDLEVSPLLRLSPRSEHRPVHRFQALYAAFAYSLSTLNWVFWKDFDYFTRRKLGPYEGRRHPAAEIAIMVGGKVFYFGWAVVLPLLVLPVAWWQVAIGVVTIHLVGGLILGVIFQLAHVVEATAHPAPDLDGRMEWSWMIHEMHTTANFSTKNRLLTWYVGGLNYQIEHHLFPKTCSVHYPALGAMVREVAARHGLPYHENPAFLGALRSHWRMLARLGRGERASEPLLSAAAVPA
jgi:linoleoyl-CoA desaturase